jgi:tRNA pseudouridine55 synthase
VIAVGPATRFLQYLPLEPKEYIADMAFGATTDTFDAEGEIVSREAPPADLRSAIESAAVNFRGLIQQLPPMHSAVKVKGQPLYKYARSGQEVEREARTVHIETLEVLECGDDAARIRVICSGGTYIRTLAHDIGQTLGCGAYLAGLVRTRVGRFQLDRAVDIAESQSSDLIPLAEALPPLPLIQLTEEQTHSVREGRAIHVSETVDGPLAALLEPDGNVFSVARVTGVMLQPECVIPREALHGAL